MNNEIEAIKAIKVELDKIKESGSLKDFFSILDEGLSGKTIKKEHRYMAFLLCIDAISQRLYSKDPENGYYAIELSKYTNGETGYFDLLFKHASLLIRDLIFEEIEKSPEKDDKFKDYKMNVILKMDTHNNPQGKSKYSLITHAGDFFITDENCNSLAYTLFFDYSLFCNSKKDNKELTDDEIYTVHKEFINEKTARSFAYQFKNSSLIKYIDGNEETETNNDLNKGEKYYKDFISYILNRDLIIKDASEKDGSDFSKYLIDSNTDNSWKEGKSLSSFSYYNLGIPGFESWGTLMIESTIEVKTVYEKFYRRGGENDDTLLLSQIKNVISALKKIDDEYNDALNKQKIRKESEKSAKAAIMSRNMSHNLGSHVMSYLKQNLSSVRGMLNDKILYELVKNEKIVSNITENLEMPFLVGLGHFVSYLQERQDFIATIATDFIPYNSTVNFKDGIYDMLNPDKKYERHSRNKETVLQTDNILLGNIARSEGLGRPTSPTKVYVDKIEGNENEVLEEGIKKLCDIVLKFRDFNGDPTEKGSDSDKSLSQMRDYNVSLPSGIVGRQAVFSIIENVIRNAAKHGKWRSQGDLELTFDIYTNRDEDFERLPTHDNEDGCLSLRDVVLKYYSKAKDKDDIYIVTLTDNCDFSLESLGKLRFALQDKYVDEKGGMNSGNKGLKEIRISAAWLRAIKDENNCLDPYPKFEKDKMSKDDYLQLLSKDEKWNTEESTNKLAPIVYARISAERDIYEDDYNNEQIGEVLNCHLQYVFCLAIPRKVAIISPIEFDKKKKKEFASKNWRTYTLNKTKNEFLEERNKSFDFILCDDVTETIEDIYKCIRPIASARVFRFSEIEDLTIQNLMSSSFNTQKYERLLYKKISSYEDGDYINIDDKTVFGCFKADAKKTNGIVVKKENSNTSNEVHIVESINIADKSLAIQDEWPVGEYHKKDLIVASDGANCGKYVYRRHHETEEEFKTFMNKTPEFHGYVEGISGGNSTDRLVRGGKYDDIWFYSHLHSMKQQIAIFDERLFTKVSGLEENDFVRGNVNNSKTDFEDLRAYYSELTKNQDIINKIEATSDIIDLDYTINKYCPEILYKKEVSSKGILPYTYQQKGIYVFTLIEDIYNKKENQRKYNLIGIKHEKGKPVTGRDNYFCLFTHIAEFAFNEDDSFDINIFDSGDFMKKKFDFISIHQGLLDKLYELSGIKGTDDESKKKIEITDKIFAKFSQQENDDSASNGFLPGVIIHSGRSKPGLREMPQKLPFIQYASLENAVMDCKYTLVELLDFARYE